MRRIVGNLDAESALVPLVEGGAGRRARKRGSQQSPALSLAALETAAALATLLRAFAAPGDRLWTPAPVDPGRMPEVPGLPRPVLESGPLGELSPAEAVLAWGETPAVARSRRPERGRGGPDNGGEGAPSTLAEILWRLPVADPAVAAAVNHRDFARRVAEDLGVVLPGTRWITSLEQLEAHLAAGGAAASPTGGWVVKAPLSAAGRDRYVESGSATATPDVPNVSGTSPGTSPKVPGTSPVLAGHGRRRVEGLLRRHGGLLFEPWMARTEDFGLAAVPTEDGPRVVGFHRLLVSPRGGFAGVELEAAFRGLEAFLGGADAGEASLWRRTVDAVGRALAGAGYAGPFGLDGYRHRGADGVVRLHPLGEINARLTFGLVARALADRVGKALGWPARSRVRLRVGRAAPGPAAVTLLLPAETGSPGAWLEVFSEAGPAAG